MSASVSMGSIYLLIDGQEFVWNEHRQARLAPCEGVIFKARAPKKKNSVPTKKVLCMAMTGGMCGDRHMCMSCALIVLGGGER